MGGMNRLIKRLDEVQRMEGPERTAKDLLGKHYYVPDACKMAASNGNGMIIITTAKASFNAFVCPLEHYYLPYGETISVLS